MFDPFRPHPAAARAAGPRPPIHAVPRAPQAPQAAIDTAARPHRQNGMGDVVIPVEHGEIVALPRLWDFDLDRIDGDAAVLRTDTGLTAVVTLHPDTAVVDGVTDVAPGREIA